MSAGLNLAEGLAVLRLRNHLVSTCSRPPGSASGKSVLGLNIKCQLRQLSGPSVRVGGSEIPGIFASSTTKPRNSSGYSAAQG